MKIFAIFSLLCVSVSISAFEINPNFDLVTNEQRLLDSIQHTSYTGTKAYLKRIQDQTTADELKNVINNGLAIATKRVSETDAFKFSLLDICATGALGLMAGAIYFFPKKDTSRNFNKWWLQGIVTGAACVILREYFAANLFKSATKIETHLRKELKKIK